MDTHHYPSTLDTHLEERIFRMKVRHANRQTTISMDQIIFDHLAKKLGDELKAKDWIRARAKQLPVNPARRPSLSRRIQEASIVFLLQPESDPGLL